MKLQVDNYTKTTWINGSEPALNAENLNKIEAGIEAATNGVIALETSKSDKSTTYTKTEVDKITTKYIGSNEIDKCDRDDYRYIAYATDLNGYTGYHTVICTPGLYNRTQYLLSQKGGIQYRTTTRSNTNEAWGAWGAWKKVEGSSSGGTNGKSAYQIAVENGFVGTEQQWLESLKGKTPVKGTDYFTADDITSIVNAVYAKIADGTEVSY